MDDAEREALSEEEAAPTPDKADANPLLAQERHAVEAPRAVGREVAHVERLQAADGLLYVWAPGEFEVHGGAQVVVGVSSLDGEAA